MRWLVVVLTLLALILVPFGLFEEQFSGLAEGSLRGDTPGWYSAVAIVLLLTLDVFLPIPSSVVAASAGVFLGFWWGSAAVWAGMTGSCLLGYGFGARASASARRFVGEPGLARASHLADRYGDYALVFCRPIPVLAEASVIFAGVVGRPLGRFLSVTAWSNLGVAVGYAAIGAYAMQVDSFLLAFLGSLLVPAVALVIGRLWLKG